MSGLTLEVDPAERQAEKQSGTGGPCSLYLECDVCGAGQGQGTTGELRIPIEGVCVLFLTGQMCFHM